MQILFLGLFNAGTSHFVVCLHSTMQTPLERKNNDIWICSFFYFFSLLYSVKAP